MIDGLILTIHRTSSGQWSATEGEKLAFGSTPDEARVKWLQSYAEEYGVQEKPKQLTVVVPFEEADEQE